MSTGPDRVLRDLGSAIDEAAAVTVPRKSYKDAVADLLRQRIFSGELRADERIDQDQLAADLGVSKLPVREALIALEAEGLVTNQPHRGSFVAPLSRDDVRDHYAIIAFLAGIAARRAAERLTDEQCDGLERCLRALDGETDPARQSQLNYVFHRAINLVGGSRRVRSVLRLLTNTNPNRFYEFAGGWANVARDEHWDIMRALRARDAEAAERAMQEHIVSGGDFGLRTMEASRFWHRDTATENEGETPTS
jgi:DNA-binding GntR family transcriptional regulator